MKKKLLNLFMLVLFASAILLTSCDASGGMPGASADFAFEIVSILKDKETADKLKGMMCY